MNVKSIAIVSALLLTACGNESDDFRTGKSDILGRVDSCDLRHVFGTCVEYTLTELDDWYREYVESACPKNRRGQLIGAYKKDVPCPSENRVARCEGMIEDPAERYEYDKHYYAGTADGYSWQSTSVQVTCEQVSGHFIAE
jgi:hypothetical protein